MAPSALPTLAVAVIVVLALALFLKNLHHKAADQKEPSLLVPKNILNIFFFTLFLFLSTATMKVVGFIPGSILTILLFALFMGIRNIPIITLIAVLPPVLVYFILIYGLRIPLPQ